MRRVATLSPTRSLVSVMTAAELGRGGQRTTVVSLVEEHPKAPILHEPPSLDSSGADNFFRPKGTAQAAYPASTTIKTQVSEPRPKK